MESPQINPLVIIWMVLAALGLGVSAHDLISYALKSFGF
jgi:hypothetical protein